MRVPGLFFRRTPGAFVLFLLFLAVTQTAFFDLIAVDDLIDRLTVAAGLHPGLAGGFVLRDALFDEPFLLPDGFPQAIEKHTIILDTQGVQATAGTGFEIACILFTVNTQFFQFGTLSIQVLLALAKFAHGLLFAALGDALDRLHAF